MKFAAV